MFPLCQAAMTLILLYQAGYFTITLIEQISTHYLHWTYVKYETGQTTMETEDDSALKIHSLMMETEHE